MVKCISNDMLCLNLLQQTRKMVVQPSVSVKHLIYFLLKNIVEILELIIIKAKGNKWEIGIISGYGPQENLPEDVRA